MEPRDKCNECEFLHVYRGTFGKSGGKNIVLRKDISVRVCFECGQAQVDLGKQKELASFL
jgi:hypothetical protein